MSAERSERVLDQLEAYLERERDSARAYRDRARRYDDKADEQFFFGAKAALTDALAELKRLRASQER